MGNNDLALRCLSVFPLQFEMCGRVSEMRGGITGYAGIAQLVERNLAKVEVAGSRPVSRSTVFKKREDTLPFFVLAPHGAVAKRLCTGLQIRVGRFDSGPRLQFLFIFQRVSARAV